MKPSEQMRLIGNGLANEATTRAQAHSAGASILRLAAVMAALEKDAERYRWLRSNGEPDAGMAYRPDWKPEMYDASVDAAIGAASSVGAA